MKKSHVHSPSNIECEAWMPYKTCSQNGTTAISSVKKWYLPIFIVLLVALVTYAGCTNHEDVANPLDAENLRTAGSPAGLAVAAGDAQVTVSWQDLGFEGIAKYRIYRRFSGDSNSTFTLVGEIDAPATEFLDTQDLINLQ
jgi:hypothetical protein